MLVLMSVIVMMVFMMMTVVMVVMVVMMSTALCVLNVAMLFCALLTLTFKLKSNVPNAVLVQLLAYCRFYCFLITVCNNMHRCIIALSVHTPNMDMMNTKHSVDVKNMLLNLVYLNASRHLFKEELKHLLKISHRIDKNENSNAY